MYSGCRAFRGLPRGAGLLKAGRRYVSAQVAVAGAGSVRVSSLYGEWREGRERLLYMQRFPGIVI